MKKQFTILIVLIILSITGIILTLIYIHNLQVELKKIEERQETIENNLKAYFQTLE